MLTVLLSAKRNFRALQKKAGGAFFCFLVLSITAEAQSFYYTRARIGSENSTAVDYYFLLTVELNGSTRSRVVYTEPGSGLQRLVEQKFIDSVTAEGPLIPNAKQYLVPDGGPSYKDTFSKSGFADLRILFQRKADGSGYYCIPTGIEYKTGDGGWQGAAVDSFEEKSFDELQKDKDFTRIFYNPTDPFYVYLFDFNSRGLNKTEQNAKLYLVAVANTKDPTIGASAAKDLAKVFEAFHTIALRTGIGFSADTVSADAFGKKNTEAVLDRLKPGKRDIVVFYYSGHGFRMAEDKSDYPRMSLRMSKTQNLNENNLAVEDVYQRLLRKGAGFTLVLGDCCNVTGEDTSALGRAPFRTKGIIGMPPNKLNVDNFRKLFLPDQPGSILIGAAEKYQLAVGNPALGGFFTNFFLAELVQAFYSSGSATWAGLLNTARENTRRQSLSALCGQERCSQRAVMEIKP